MATTFAAHGTLTISTVATVTLTAPGPTLLIVNRHATDPIYYTFSGSAAPANPTVGGDDTYCCPAGAGKLHKQGAFGSLIVKLISAAAAPYDVET